MPELALSLIAEAKRANAKTLDLGNCGLTELPDALFDLVELEELYLCSKGWSYDFEKKEDKRFESQNEGEKNNIKRLSPKIGQLKNLKTLLVNDDIFGEKWDLSDLSPLKDLAQLQLLYVNSTQVSDLSPLKDLANLQQLDVSDTQVSDLSPLKDLANLQQLYVYSTQVSDLSPLKDLANLQQLYVSDTQVSDLSPLKDLANLQLLSVSDTQVSDLSPLKDLANLQQLSVSDTQVSDLSPLKDLANLQQLNVYSTQVSDLSPLKDLANLQKLNVYSTQVSNLSSLKDLANLQKLDVDNTKVSDLSSLKDLKKLNFLSADNCLIKRFEAIIPVLDKNSLPDLNSLYVFGNPIYDIDEKYLGIENENSLEKLRKFYKQWQKGDRLKLYEAKLILVGEGEVGKTSLKLKLKTNKHVAKAGKQPSTEGILYEPWDLKNCIVAGKRQNVRINIWDFGGQEIDHQTHQFFLSDRSFYIFVSSSRHNDAQAKFDYWLNIVHKLAPNSPILMVRNLFDNQTKPFRFQEWLKKYPEQISQKPITINCKVKDDEGVEDVLTYLRQKINELESVGKEWPKNYANIRFDLEKLAVDGTNYIAESDYFDICEKHDVDEEEALLLSKTLHSIGTILHYQEIEELKGWVILNPEWATKAFYRIVRNDDINERKGHFTHKQLKKVWWQDEVKDKKRYPLSIFDTLLALMKVFGLCFQLQEKREYIVPQLLDEIENEEATSRIVGDDILRFEYHYNDVIPAGMISRFICKQHENIVKDNKNRYLYWRYGVLVERENTIAIVEQPIGDKIIKIAVKGDSKKELLAVLRNAFEELHKPLNNLQPEEILPCNCSICCKSEKPHPFKYKIIKRRYNDPDVYEKCEVSDERVDRRQLFNDSIDESFGMKQQIRKLILESNLEGAFEKLPKDDYIIVLQSRFAKLKNQSYQGLLSHDESNKEWTKITAGLLSYLSDYDKHSFKDGMSRVKGTLRDTWDEEKTHQESSTHEPTYKIENLHVHGGQVNIADKISKIKNE